MQRSAFALLVVTVSLVVGVFIHQSQQPPPPLSQQDILRSSFSKGVKYRKLGDGRYQTWWEYGDKSGTPLIALHGLGLGPMQFESIDEYFRQKKIWCIAPTIVGGLYDYSPNITIESLAEDVIDLANHLKIEKFYTIGTSLGTLLQQALVQKYSSRMIKAGLFGPSPSFSEITENMKIADELRFGIWLAKTSPTLSGAMFWVIFSLTNINEHFVVNIQVGNNTTPEERQLMIENGVAHRWAETIKSTTQRDKGFSFNLVYQMALQMPNYKKLDVDCFVYVTEYDGAHAQDVARYVYEKCPEDRRKFVVGKGKGQFSLFWDLEPVLEEFLP